MITLQNLIFRLFGLINRASQTSLDKRSYLGLNFAATCGGDGGGNVGLGGCVVGCEVAA